MQFFSLIAVSYTSEDYYDTCLVEAQAEKYILRVYQCGWKNKEEVWMSAIGSLSFPTERWAIANAKSIIL